LIFTELRLTLRIYSSGLSFLLNLTRQRSMAVTGASLPFNLVSLGAGMTLSEALNKTVVMIADNMAKVITFLTKLVIL
jgi:hypothetical protein